MRLSRRTAEVVRGLTPVTIFLQVSKLDRMVVQRP